MHKVISINLNGHAYHLEEAGYDALRAYLDTAAARLQANPDRAEILADLEQAIAEKCTACLNPNKTVVTGPEVDRILAEMGPVRDPEAQDAEPAAAGGTQGDAPRTTSAGEPKKRLYQIREGAMFTGVCNGLAAYLGVDVTIVRVIFVILAVLTKGAWAIVYLVLSFVIPYADTGEERAAAHGVMFTAQEVVDRAKEIVGSQRDKHREWRRQWRRARRRHIVGAPEAMSPQVGYAGQVWGRAAVPLLGVLQAAAFVLLVLSIISFVNTSTLFGWPVPKTLPLWAGILLLVLAYQIVTAPLHSMRHALYYTFPASVRPPQDVIGGLLSLVAAAFGFWLLYQYVPEVRDFVEALPAIGREVWDSVR